MFPPCVGRDTSTGLGTTRRDTSPIPMRLPASSRTASIRCISARSESSSCGVSRPVLPKASAAMTTTGIAMSTQLASTPWIRSSAFPVGRSFPVTAPSASRKVSLTGAAGSVDLQRMRGAHDAEQDRVPPPGIGRQIRGEEIGPARGAAAHEHTGYLALHGQVSASLCASGNTGVHGNVYATGTSRGPAESVIVPYFFWRNIMLVIPARPLLLA